MQIDELRQWWPSAFPAISETELARIAKNSEHIDQATLVYRGSRDWWDADRTTTPWQDGETTT